MTNDPQKEVIVLMVISAILLVGFAVGIVYQLKQLGF